VLRVTDFDLAIVDPQGDGLRRGALDDQRIIFLVVRRYVQGWMV
jgi:hypothetical protein